MSGRVATRLALFAILLLAAAPDAPAECAFAGATHVTWPSVSPVWDLCFRRPSQSSGANGSGLEISEVKYNGTTVIFQAHIPILNIKYVENPSGCGSSNLCYRDWFDSEQAFECAPTVSPGICSGSTTPAKTVCEACTDATGLECRDIGAFQGVAVESLADRLKLTAQAEAGWYRYIPIWEFLADGTIQAKFAVTSIDHTCVAYTHDHHAYYRLDLDVSTKAGNFVDRVLPGGSTERVTVERNFVDVSPARSKWRVASAGSPYVVEVARNPGDGAAGDPFTVPNDFPVADGWVLAYDATEISDYPFRNFSFCPANIDPWDNNQNVDGADVVLWVRAGSLHEGEGSDQSAHCGIVGPTIKVLPNPVGPLNFHSLATPCRVADTRDSAGPYGGPALQAGATRDFVLANRCGVPATAKSVAVNLTVTQPTTSGHITTFPAGQPVPLASSLNFSGGQTRANNAILPLGAAGAISVHTVLAPVLSPLPQTVHFILDVTGWFE